MDVVEIRRKHAIAVMHVIAEVFGDINTSDLPAVDISGAEQCRDESVRPDWAQVWDDSSLLLMLDTRDLEGVSFLSDTSEEFNDSRNPSSFVENASDMTG